MLFCFRNLHINSLYYITKQILPALKRLFDVIDVDVVKWYEEMPKSSRIQSEGSHGVTSLPKWTITDYYSSNFCIVCGKLCEKLDKELCAACSTDEQSSNFILTNKFHKADRQLSQMISICMQCEGFRDPNVACISLDCPIYFERIRLNNKLHNLRKPISTLFI